MRRRVVAGLMMSALALAVPLACGFGDLDGLTGGPVDAAPGPVLDGAMASDSGLDSSSSTDGDAASRPDASRATCGASTAKIALCEDFSGDELENGWSVVTAAGGTVGPQAFLPDSGLPARALVAAVPDAATGTPPLAYWEKAYSQVVSKLSFDADLAFSTYAINGDYKIVVNIQLNHGTGFSLIYFDILEAAAGFALQEFTPTPGQIDPHGFDLAANAVHHLHFDVQIAGESHLLIDGAPVLDFATANYILAGIPTLRIGVAGGVVPAGNETIGIANLVFTAE